LGKGKGKAIGNQSKLDDKEMVKARERKAVGEASGIK